MFKKLILAAHFSLLLVVGGVCSAASLEKAIEAYEFEEYGDAFKWLKPWASDGEAEAQYRLGIMYEKGYGVDTSSRKALKWYRLAAAQGHRASKRRLKNLRQSTITAAGSESVATQWYQDLAEEGDPDAQYNLGFMHETGWSTPVDEGEAARWYEKAAKKGILKARFRLGMMYLVGAGVKRSEIQGEKWLKLAAKDDHELASIIKEELLEAEDVIRINIDLKKIINKVRQTSIKNEKKAEAIILNAVNTAQKKADKEEAKKKQRLAKIQGIKSATSQNIISDDELLGAGGEKTLRWYQVKAERGLPEAQFMLGQFYEYGQRVKKSLAEAVDWYTLAAEQGHSEAQYNLGMWYANGIFVQQDEELASRYLTSAAKNGHKKSNKFLERTTAGKLVDNQESIAVWWLQKFALQGSADASFRLGYLYEFGRGVAMNLGLAKRLYAVAAKSGHKAAIKRLGLVGTGRPISTGSVKPPIKKTTSKKPAQPLKASGASDTASKSDELMANLSIENLKKSSMLWYGLVSLIIIAPIFGFFMVIKREKVKDPDAF